MKTISDMNKMCPSCGAKLTYAEEIQTNCSYCGEPLLMNIPDDAIRSEAVRRNLFGRKRKVTKFNPS